MANFIVQKYDYVVNDLADPRVKDWLGFASPLGVLGIIVTYLFTIYVLLPAYMKNREPYNLKTFLYYYNVLQIVYCLTIIYGIISTGCTWGCQIIDYSTNQDAVTMLNWFYYTHILKGIELSETVVFVLRKKYNQVSKLHVYHHASTFFLSWIAVKYVGGGMVAFPVLINCCIHVMMYTYYLLSSLGQKWQKRISKWKPRLTMFQMIQFCVLILHSLQSLHPECKVPKQLLLIYLPDVFLVFYMFWQFYKENYMKKQKV